MYGFGWFECSYEIQSRSDNDRSNGEWEAWGRKEAQTK